MRKSKAYTCPKITVTELDIKDIITLSIVDNNDEDGKYKGENSAFWEG